MSSNDRVVITEWDEEAEGDEVVLDTESLDDAIDRVLGIESTGDGDPAPGG